MLSVENVGLSKGRSYYTSENYYSKESAQDHSQWYGLLATQLGLSGKVVFSDFDNILFGFDKAGKQALTQNAVDPKKYLEPEITKEERGIVEFTLKKVSDSFNIKDTEYTKIKEILDHYMRHNKKIKVSESAKCIKSIKNVLNSSEIKREDIDNILEIFSTSIARITRDKERRGGYDLTFSAPKSVSIMALVHNDQEIVKAHRESIFKVLDYIEANYANTRTGNNLKREIENTKKLMIATFEHDTSRALDPQLHTHCVVMNMLQRSDEEWRSLHADEFRNFSKLFGVMYQNELGHRIKELGYEIDLKQNGTFDIKGFSQEHLELFSKRRKQLLELGVTDQKSARELVLIQRAKKGKEINREDLVQRWKNESKNFSHEVEKVLNLKNHEKELSFVDKLKNFIFVEQKNETSIEKLITEAFEQSSEMKVAFKKEEALLHIINNNHTKYNIKDILPVFEKMVLRDLVAVGDSSRGNLIYVTKETLKLEEETKVILERKPHFESILSANKAEKILSEKLTLSRSLKKEILNDLEKTISTLKNSNKKEIKSIFEIYLKGNKRISEEKNGVLKDDIRTKISRLNLSKSLKSEIKSSLNSYADKITQLNEGQRNAIRETITSTEGNLTWLGVAGAGKTFSLSTVIEEAKKADYEVRGFAQNKDAAGVLSKETKIEAQTIAKLLYSMTDFTNVKQKKLWIVDEAGMIGAKLGYEFVKRAEDENARLIFVGDLRQMSSPTAGHFLKFITKYTNVKTLRLTKSVRQKDENLSNGVDLLNKLSVENLGNKNYRNSAKEIVQKALIHFHDSIQEFKSEEGRRQNVVKSFLSLSEREREKTVIVAKTHDSIYEITNNIRKSLKEEGFLKNEIIVKTHIPLNITGKQSMHSKYYEIGHVILTKKINSYLKTDEMYRITGVDHAKNTVYTSDSKGRRLEFNARHISSLETGAIQFKSKDISICENDVLCWKKNENETDTKAERVNKQMFKVESINHKTQKMVIKYERGTKAIINLNDVNFMDYAWAVTYNAVQGATKKHTIGIVEDNSNYEDIYTLFTRPTHTLKVFAPSKESLEKSLLRSGSKKTATELVQEIKEEEVRMHSNKMDFYDRYQKCVSFDKQKDGKQNVILSFVAPSDLSAYYYALDNENKKIVISAHEKSISQTMDKFKELNNIKYNLNSNINTRDAIFDDKEKGFSKIQYIHSNLEIKGYKDNSAYLNSYQFVENQPVIKNLYLNYLCDNLKEMNLNFYNEAGILRLKERSDHIHAEFSEYFESNMRKLFGDKMSQDKFSSAYEIENKLDKYSVNNKNKNSRLLNFDEISKDIKNDNEKEYIKKNKEEVVKEILFKISKDLQIFDEKVVLDSVLGEMKGHDVSTHDMNHLFKEAILNRDIRFLAYDRFGKMLFAHKELNNEEANILMHSMLRGQESSSVLSLERVFRRIEKKSLSNDEAAALLHFTCDKGGVKFVSNMKKEGTQDVLYEVNSLYTSAGYKVFHVYAGRQAHSDLNNPEFDLHVNNFVDKLKEKRMSLNDKTVLILKDIGHNISKTASELFNLAEKNGTKIICIADENDFKTDENKRFFNDLKRTVGIHLKNRYTGYLKQKLFYDKMKGINNKKIQENKNPALYAKPILKFNAHKNELSNVEKSRLQGIMTDIKSYYVNSLFSEQGRLAREYMNKRGFSDEQLKEFGFGLSFTNSLEVYAKNKGYSKEDLINLSLMTRKENGETYDFYRNRIMIPINDEDGHCIGFGGRIYRQYEVDKNASKYINPRNTDLFNKSETLFGLDRAKNAIALNKEVLVVEGYMDAIALQKAGVNNVVAVLGTSLTDKNIENLSTISDEAILLFDNDNAGRKAATRSYLQSLSSDMKLSFATVTGGKDPDEYLKKNSVAQFENDVLGKKTPLDYFVNNSFLEKEKNDKHLAISNWRKDILPNILSMKDDLKRSFELRSASIVFDESLTSLLEKKHYKFLPSAFLTENELEDRNKYLQNINNLTEKSSKQFDNTLSSRERMKNLLTEEEIKKGIIFEMTNRGLITSQEEIKAFIENNKNIYSDIKIKVEYNEEVIANKIYGNNKNNLNFIDIYKHRQEKYSNLSPQEVSVQLFNENRVIEMSNTEQKLNQDPFSIGQKIFESIENGEFKSNEFQFYSVESLKTKAMIFSYKNSSDINANNSSILSNEKFVDYLQSTRLLEASKLQENYQNECKFIIRNKLGTYSNEHMSGIDKLDNVLLEKAYTRTYGTFFKNLIDKEKSFDENVNVVNGFYSELKNGDLKTDKFYTIFSEKLHSNFNESVNENTNVNSAKNNFVKMSYNSNESMKNNVVYFEKMMKSLVHDKINDKSNSLDVFNEVRKTFVKEATYLDRNEKNPSKAYMNVANIKNIDYFVDIMSDIDLKEIEASLQKEKGIKFDNTKNNVGLEKIKMFTENELQFSQKTVNQNTVLSKNEELQLNDANKGLVFNSPEKQFFENNIFRDMKNENDISKDNLVLKNNFKHVFDNIKLIHVENKNEAEKIKEHDIELSL